VHFRVVCKYLILKLVAGIYFGLLFVGGSRQPAAGSWGLGAGSQDPLRTRVWCDQGSIAHRAILITPNTRGRNRYFPIAGLAAIILLGECLGEDALIDDARHRRTEAPFPSIRACCALDESIGLRSPIEADKSSGIFRPGELLSQYIGGKPIFWMRER